MCMMILVVRKIKSTKAEQIKKWLKLEKERYVAFREQVLRGPTEVLQDDWTTTADVIREICKGYLEFHLAEKQTRKLGGGITQSRSTSRWHI